MIWIALFEQVCMTLLSGLTFIFNNLHKSTETGRNMSTDLFVTVGDPIAENFLGT
jgi:hypothetical protein